MRALIDTNVIMDFIAKRSPWYKDARMIVNACDKNIFDGSIAAHSIPDMYYILRKSIPVEERREALRLMCGIFNLDKNKLVLALADDAFSDFEDCLQFFCASEFQADYIVTRNPGDFKGSSIPVVSPHAFCEMFLA